jgi:hypothetical protein
LTAFGHGKRIGDACYRSQMGLCIILLEKEYPHGPG